MVRRSTNGLKKSFFQESLSLENFHTIIVSVIFSIIVSNEQFCDGIPHCTLYQEDEIAP